MAWGGTPRGARGALAAALALAATAAAPAAAGALTTFGSSLPAPSAGYYDSCAQACTAAMVELPGATTRSPVDGTIVRFRLRTGAGSDAQQVRFRVLRTSDGSKFTGVGTSAAFNLPTTAGVAEFPVSMPVKAGDYIGIDLPSGNKQAMVVAQNAGAFQAGWFPALGDGAAPSPSGNPHGSAPTLYDLLLQADVEPSSTTTPPSTPSAPQQPHNCTDARGVATCADPSQPALCGPTSLGFPQCSLPVNLPTACSGAGTGLPTCNLPGNYVVACGSIGLNLGVCRLPPVTVPQVCGPTTAGLQPCAPANTQVLACGATTAGLPACGFKTLIAAPKPIDLDSGELDLVVGCPSTAAGSARSAVAAETPKTCSANVDLADLVATKLKMVLGWADTLSFTAYLGGNADPEFAAYANQYPDASRHNWVTFNFRARALALDYLKSELGSGYNGDPFQALPSSTATSLASLLSSKAPSAPGFSLGTYEDPVELWQRADAFLAARRVAGAIVDSVNELYQVQERTRRKQSSRAASPVAGAAAASGPVVFHKRVTIRRGRKGTRIHLKLPRSMVRALRRRASHKSHAVAMRLVVSFDAKPRPIVRFVDFRLPVKQKAKSTRHKK